MKKLEKLYEGKAKIIYQTDDENLVIQHFKDDATAFDGVKKDTVMGKGVANNNISSKLFNLLHKEGIQSHFEKKLNDNEMLVKKVEIIQVETIVRNISAGSFCRKYGVEEGIVFEKPTVEFSYKSDEYHDPLMNDDHIRVMKLASEEEIAIMRKKALEINEILKKFFDSIGIIVVDFKLEFGRYKGQVLLADEISPDTCRFWDKETREKLDKDRFRFDLGGVEETYAAMMKRIGD
jgi:phosphoribosylaminoimidazole-succinocarboxamide synthase